jgi:hypothetical protein
MIKFLCNLRYLKDKMGLSILLIGLPLDHHAIPAEVRDSIGQRLKDLQSSMEAAGLEFSIFYCSPETGLDGFVDKLRADRCDGVIMGGGLTRNPNLFYFMEQIVDVTHTNAPKAKIMFIAMPEDVPDTLRRWFTY